MVAKIIPSAIDEAPVKSGKKSEADTSVAVTAILSDGKTKQYYDDAVSLLSEAQVDKEIAYVKEACALYNVKTLKLHDAAGITWEEFCKELDYSERSVQNYLMIGRAFKGLINDTSGDPQFRFKKAHIVGIANILKASNQNRSLREISKHARSTEKLKDYLDGKIQVTSVKGLLSQPDPEDDTRKEEELEKERLSREYKDGRSATMRALAEEKGYVWDEKTNTLRTRDGKPLSKAQRAELLTAADFLRPFEAITKKLSHALAEVYTVAKEEGEQYALFLPRANEKDRQLAKSLARTVQKQSKTLQDIANALLAGDMDAIEEAYKNSPLS